MSPSRGWSLGNLLAPLRDATPRLADRLDLARLHPDSAGSIARERMRRAEREVSLLRLAAVAVNAIVYLLLMDPVGTRPALAYTLIAVSAVYGLVTAAASWSRRAPSIVLGPTTVAADALLIAFWIYATGGLSSPFHVLWYASIAAVAYRFDLLQVGLASGGYVALYGFVIALDGQVLAAGDQFVLHSAYIPLTGGMVALLSHAHASESEARLEIEAARTERERERISRVEEKWRSILENAPEIVMMVDAGGRIDYCNLATTPEEHEQIRGAPVTDWLPDRAHDRFEQALERVLHEGETTSFEIEGRRPGGGLGAYVTRMGPITKDGEVTGASLISTDISQLRSMQLEVGAQAEELERSHEILSQYTRLAAHDLQEPLRDISHYAQLIEREAGGDLPEDVAEYAEFAIQGAKRLHRLVGAMRELSELEARDLDVEEIDPAPIVGEVVTALTGSRDVPEASICIEDLDLVHADPTLLRRALVELMDNALTYAGEGAHVRVGTSRGDDSVVLWVEDDGPGIPEDYRDDAVQPFKRLQHWSDVPGVGTGLAVVDRVAHKHGGLLELRSGERGGIRAILELPARPSEVRRTGGSSNPGQRWAQA